MEVLRERARIRATSYVGIASYSMLIYDHLLTFSDEVEYIWTRRKGPVIYLFLLNRYLFPFAFAVNLYAYQSRRFDPEVCKHFVRYEGATAVVAFGVTGLMMILRVNALYGGKNRVVQAILGTLWLGQIGVYAWLLSTSMPVPHHKGIRSCSLIYDPKRMSLASLSASAPLVFDTAVIVLTLYKTLGMPRRCDPTSKFWSWNSIKRNVLMKTLVLDGVLYYIVVFSTNLTLIVMIVTVSDGIKNILAQFSQLITVTMMSRITLRPRKVGAKRSSTVIVSSGSSARGSLDSTKGLGSEYSTRYSRVEFAHPTPVLPEIQRMETLHLESGWSSGGMLVNEGESRAHVGGRREDGPSLSSSEPGDLVFDRPSLLKNRKSFVR